MTKALAKGGKAIRAAIASPPCRGIAVINTLKRDAHTVNRTGWERLTRFISDLLGNGRLTNTAIPDY
ncbi:hypothetical protein OVA03_05865 [Asticcacaulis sp. SL142]|uniref:hypothetical protein n=1 Tax=Asticcacaulis sp. SL142 TaxID=2995155 RepID=UPI00226CE08D|nr:hypothetical protein [Asticcacaulis sp. SL142]WAC49431.1 hypothetical protein OVA03_05865 [Asticcacaulis sp. SL142]